MVLSHANIFTNVVVSIIDFSFSWYGFLSTILVTIGLLRPWLRRYFEGGKCRSNARLDGKVAIITGGNRGIGKETARDFIRRGAEVILACRNTDQAEEAAAGIRAFATGNGSIIVKKLDLASLKSVRAFSKGILQAYPKLHLLVNNAGLVFPKSKTEDGFEMVFGTNHLGHFLLANLLLDRLKESAPSRIVVVSSRAHFFGHMDFNDIAFDKNYDPFISYSRSKLANILFARELHKKVASSNVSVFSLHPGTIKTNMNRTLPVKPWVACIFDALPNMFYKTLEGGAQTTIYCAIQEGIEHLSGSYFSDCKVAKESSEARDDGVAKKLWELSEKMVGITD